jgi:chromosome segregation ATPase
MKGEPMEENKNTPEITVMSVEESQAIQADDLVNNGLKLAQMGIAQMCAGVRMMHDGKLYKHFGFQNFEDYCKSKGFSKSYGERLVRVAVMLEEKNAESIPHFEKLGTAKLFQLAMLEPEQREEIIQTVNVESVTVKELQSQISQMKTRQKQDAEKITELTLEKEGIYQQMEAVQERIDGLEAEKKQAQERIEELKSRSTEVYKDEKDQAEIERLTAENNQLKIENEALEEQRTELETKINELDSPLTSGENRHKVEAEIAQAVNNATKGLIAQNQSMQEQNQRDIQKIHQGYQKEIAELKKQIAEKSDIPEESPQMKAFKIRLATLADSIELLVKFLCENPEMSYLDKSGQVLKGAENSLTEIRKQVQG